MTFKNLLFAVGTISISAHALDGALTLKTSDSPQSSSSQSTDTTLTKLQNRNGIEVTGDLIKVYHSQEADKEDIRFTQQIVTNAVTFFEKSKFVNIKLDVYAAILSKHDWEGIPVEEEVAPGKIVPVPYGMPGLSDKGPYGAILGTSYSRDVDNDVENVLIAGNLEVVRKLPKDRQQMILKAGFKDLKEAARKMPFLVAIHEMGHVYARKLGIAFENHQSRVVEEMLANFFLYAFLNSKKDFSKYVTLWNQVLEGYVTTQCPTHRTMSVFDEIYFGVTDPSTGGSIMNFLFYQGMAQKAASHSFRRHGLGFVSKVQQVVKSLKAGASVGDFYGALAGTDPFYKEWYESFDHSAACQP